MKKFKLLSALILLCILASSLMGCYKFTKIKDSHYEQVDENLINPNANENAKKLYSFLRENYGKTVITGQYINEYEKFDADRFLDENGKTTVFKANEVQAVYSVTQKYPAMLGFDVSQKIIEDATNFSIEQAIEWHNAGGIVNFCWHWMAPTEEPSQRHFYTEKTNFNLENTLKNTDSFEYKKMIEDIDVISNEFKILQDAGVPVLWRPLHEASGAWFWWGNSGVDAYKKLWNIMYDRMTNYHKLNNLIWVYNGQNPKWYVGDDKCDIIGDDPYYHYNERKYYEKDKANAKRFKLNYKTSKKKIIAMTEIDFVPNVDEMWKENTKWSMFCTWCRDFVCVFSEDKTEGWATTTPVYNPKCTTADELKAVYHHEKAITLENITLWK